VHVSGEKSCGRADGDAGGMGVPPRWRVCVMENLKIRWMMWGHPILGHLSLSLYIIIYIYIYYIIYIYILYIIYIYIIIYI